MSLSEAHPLPRAALLFMATVEEARRTLEGPFRALSPLFRIALEQQAGRLLDLDKMVSILRPILGDQFSHHTAEAFLPALVEVGLLKETSTAANQSIYHVPETVQPLIADATQSSLAKLDRLHAAYLDFLDRKTPLLTASLDKATFQWQLFRWATSLDGINKQAIQDNVNQLLEGKKLVSLRRFSDEIHEFSKVKVAQSIEFAGFVRWLVRDKRIEELADIASLTELGLAIEFLEEVRSPSFKIEGRVDCVFILDAPVLLDLLGFSGESRRQSINNCIEALRPLGARFATLDHCLEELSGILKAVLDTPRTQRYGLTGDTLRGNSLLEGRARSVANHPDSAVKSTGVQILTFNPNVPVHMQSFPPALIDRFRNAIGWHDHTKTEQKIRDTNSVAFVICRRSEYSSDVFQSKFMLLTRNTRYTQFANTFFRVNFSAPTYAVGPAMEIKTLAATIWMRIGSRSNIDLPQLQLISACDRILVSNGELMRKAEKKVREAAGSGAAQALFESQQAVLDLVISTGGSSDVIDGASAEQIINALTKSAEERGREKQKSVMQQELLARNNELGQISDHLTQLKADLTRTAIDSLRHETTVRELREALEDREEAARQRDAAIAQTIREECTLTAHRIVAAGGYLLAAYAVLGQFFIWDGVTWLNKSLSNQIFGGSVILASVTVVFMGIRGMRGGSFDTLDWAKEKIGRQLMHLQLSRIYSEDERERIRRLI